MTPPSAELYRDPAALEQRLRVVEPAARVLSERRVRKVVRLLANEDEPPAFNPDQPVWVEADWLRELDVQRYRIDDAKRLLMLVTPDDRVATPRPDAELLRDYWRLLFRAAVAQAVTPAALWEALGPAAEGEVRFVLESDHWIAANADDATLLRTFAAVYIDRATFSANSLPQFFPSLPAMPQVLAALAPILTVAAADLLARTRPAGAADPVLPTADDKTAIEPAAMPDEAEARLTGEPALLFRQAKEAASVGNHVRAAILRMRAARCLTGTDRERAEASARSALHDGLVARLGRILQWDYQTAREWTRALTPLLAPAARGIWPRAARALYDLQKIATELERPLYTVDPIEWARTLGRRPVRRPLIRARNVVLIRHLARADHHLSRTRLPTDERNRLHDLIHGESHRAEIAVRHDLAPIIRGVFDEVGLVPANLPERVARDKLIAELLDRACEKGFLRLADLRDAVARNQLKLPDLRGPSEFFGGDALLKADARIAEELDGVYHRGEIYLRGIQRLTAVGFGTRLGRAFTKFVAIPFGGAVMAVEFAKYLAHEVHHVRKLFVDHPPEIPATAAIKHEAALGPNSLTAAIILGCFFLALMHSPPFRRATFVVLGHVWRAVRFAIVDLPSVVWRSPLIRAVRGHPVTRFVSRFFLVGFAAALFTFEIGVLLGWDPTSAGQSAAVVFVGVTLSLNSPPGRLLRERFAEGVSDTWRTIRVNLLPGLLGWILWAFRALGGALERGLYSVDEWLRFREGQSPAAFAGKVAIAAIWFPIAYLVRFGFNLLLEPQINPLKHFPVVTVSHKLLIPMIPSLHTATGLSEATVTTIVFGIPGIFGFMVWELKENWRLYAANRPAYLPPAILGHHGETMLGLLRLGFHSGTVPKLFRRLRAAERDSEVRGKPNGLGRGDHDLEATAEAITALVDRELIPLLGATSCWAESPPVVKAVRIGVQAIELDLERVGGVGELLRLRFEHRAGTITARIEELGWSVDLSPDQQAALGVALGGLAERFLAKWADDTATVAPVLEPWLRPREWTNRVAFWGGCDPESSKTKGNGK